MIGTSHGQRSGHVRVARTGVSNQLASGAQEIESQLSNLKSLVSGLVSGEWGGEASQSFMELFEQWDQAGRQLKESLVGISAQLARAALAHEEWDEVYVNPPAAGEDYGNMHFAPNNGAVVGTRVQFDNLSRFLDEFGNLPIDRVGETTRGSFMGLGGGSFNDRALPPSQRGADVFNTVQFVPGATLPDNYRIEVSLIADAYGRDGGGLQVVVFNRSTGNGVSLTRLEEEGLIAMTSWW